MLLKRGIRLVEQRETRAISSQGLLSLYQGWFKRVGTDGSLLHTSVGGSCMDRIEIVSGAVRGMLRRLSDMGLPAVGRAPDTP
jgi:hypothetical protein